MRVTGEVQGVGYRAWTARTAASLGLGGWVRNRADGSVEAHLEGAEPAVAAMIERMREGPRAAVVTGLEAAPATASGQTSFDVRPTV